jgi:hypothetical protein
MASEVEYRHICLALANFLRKDKAQVGIMDSIPFYLFSLSQDTSHKNQSESNSRQEHVNIFFSEMGKPQPLHQSDAYGFYFIKSCL